MAPGDPAARLSIWNRGEIMTRSRAFPLLALIGALAACTAGEQAEEQQPMQEQAAATMAATMPDTTAEALWSHLEDVDFRAAWTLWPGKGELYAGQQPHGMLLTTYLNEQALQAVNDQAGTMPAGAIVVKENYTPDSTLAATTVMYKVAGYNPEAGDWFYLKRLADGMVEASGRVAGCQGCHAQRADNDYLFTGSLRP
jgi:hypothetical protein